MFTDGAKGGTGATVIGNQQYFVLTASPSPQHAELTIIALFLKKELGPLNILSDSAYVVNVVKLLEQACTVSKCSTVYPY